MPVRFLVDTGASDIVLSRRGRGAGRHRPGEPQLHRPRAAPRTASSRRRRCGSGRVELGGFTDAGVPASVGAGELDVSLLGMSYLDRFASIGIEGDRMTLRR